MITRSYRFDKQREIVTLLLHIFGTIYIYILLYRYPCLKGIPHAGMSFRPSPHGSWHSEECKTFSWWNSQCKNTLSRSARCDCRRSKSTVFYPGTDQTPRQHGSNSATSAVQPITPTHTHALISRPLVSPEHLDRLLSLETRTNHVSFADIRGSTVLPTKSRTRKRRKCSLANTE